MGKMYWGSGTAVGKNNVAGGAWVTEIRHSNIQSPSRKSYSYIKYFTVYLSWYTFAYNTKNIRKNNTLIRTSQLQTENARIETCVPIIGQTFPSLLVHQIMLSMALYQRCSCCGSSQFTWYYLLIIIRYNQLLLEENLVKLTSLTVTPEST